MGWADDDNADGDFGELPATLAEPPSAGGDASSVKPQQTAAAPQAVAPSKPGGAPGGRKSYVPPHMRNRPQAQQGSGGGFGAPRLHGGPAQRGSSFAPPPPPGRGGWGGGGSGRDYGGERRRGGWGSRDEKYVCAQFARAPVVDKRRSTASLKCLAHTTFPIPNALYAPSLQAA